MRITPNQLVAALRELQRNLGDSISPAIRIRLTERRFGWSSLPAHSECAMPAIDVGQDGDWRFATDGPEGLHAHVFTSAGVADFHLDEVNVCRNAAGHAVADTHAFGGSVMGAGVGLAIGKLLGNPGLGLLLGTVGGAFIGANVPRRSRQVYAFEDLFFSGTYRVARLA
jgi:hypothetical protein